MQLGSTWTNHPCINSTYCLMFSNLFCDAFVNKALNDFVITVFHNSRITRNSRSTLLSVAKDVYLNNSPKTTHYTLLNCFIVFLLYYSFEKFSQQSFRAALHFRLHTYESCPLFLTMWYAFWAPVQCFSVLECLKSRLVKLASKSVDGHYAQTRKWNPPSS